MDIKSASASANRRTVLVLAALIVLLLFAVFPSRAPEACVVTSPQVAEESHQHPTPAVIFTSPPPETVETSPEVVTSATRPVEILLPPLPSMVSVVRSKCNIHPETFLANHSHATQCVVSTALSHCRRGLEIGGTSEVFRSPHFGVYRKLDALDNVLFAKKTIWASVDDLFDWYPNKSKGHNIFTDAEDLSPISNETYDVVMSAHNIEHLANPMKALREQVRVLRRGGVLILIAPLKTATFDHKRPTTTFPHLLSDLAKNTGPGDQTHLPEIIDLHDLSRESRNFSRQFFIARSLKNAENRALHHHVFDRLLMVNMFQYFDVEPVYFESYLHHMFLLGVKKP